MSAPQARRAHDHSLRDYVLDGLAGLGSVRSRVMFGGHGLYLGDRFFGIVYGGRLYFRTDDRSRAAYLERDMAPFRPRPLNRTIGAYYEVPPEVLEDSDLLGAWAREAAATPPRTTVRGPGRRGPVRAATPRRRPAARSRHRAAGSRRRAGS